MRKTSRENFETDLDEQSKVEYYLTLISTCYKLSRVKSIRSDSREILALEAEQYTRHLLAIMLENTARNSL